MLLSTNDIECYYFQSLLALKYLFEQTEVRYWAKWIERDLEEWENNNSVLHHLSAYGGMGSLSDLIICTENKHRVIREQEPWVNNLLMNLCSLAYTFADVLKSWKEVPVEKVVRSVGKGISKLQGWRCLSCGYAEVSLNELEYFVAYNLVRDGIIRAIVSKDLINFVEKIFQLDIPEAIEYKEDLNKIVTRSDIVISNRVGWLRPCPRCGSEDTAVYRWEKRKKKRWLIYQEEVFKPSDDNLPIR